VRPSLVRNHHHRFRSRSVPGRASNPSPPKSRHSETRRARRFRAPTPEAARVLDRRAAELDIPVTRAASAFIQSSRSMPAAARFEVVRRDPAFDPLPARRRAPGGERRHRGGWRCSPAVWTAARLKPASPQPRWPGRLEHVANAPRLSLMAPTTRRRPRAGRLYYALVLDRAPAPGLRASCATKPRRNRRYPFPPGLAGDRHRAAPIARPRARIPPRRGPITQPAVCSHPRSGSPLDRRCANRTTSSFITGSLFLVAEARELLLPRHRLPPL